MAFSSCVSQYVLTGVTLSAHLRLLTAINPMGTPWALCHREVMSLTAKTTLKA